MHSRRAVCCALSGSLAAMATVDVCSQNDPRLQASIDPPVRATPKRIAAIDADGKIIGDWVEYVDRPRTASECPGELVFDTFWPDPITGFPTDGNLCYPTFTPSTRWYFGCDYHSPLHYDDATFLPTKRPISRYQFAWMWGLTDTLIVRVSIYDMSAAGIQCERVPIGAFRGGFLIHYEDLMMTCGYYFDDIDLCQIGGMPDPPAGRGLIKTEYGRSYDGQTGFLEYSPGPVSPMFWGIEPALNRGVGEHEGWALADDTVINEQIDFPGECYDWGKFDLCPDPLAPMHAFYSVRSGKTAEEGCAIALSVSTLRVGVRPSFTINGASPGRVITIRYSKQPFGTGSPEYVQLGEFCGESELRPLFGLGEICEVVADGNGSASCVAERTIPFGYEGVTFNFQAFAGGHCPQPCDSSLVQRTVIQ